MLLILFLLPMKFSFRKSTSGWQSYVIPSSKFKQQRVKVVVWRVEIPFKRIVTRHLPFHLKIIVDSSQAASDVKLITVCVFRINLWKHRVFKTGNIFCPYNMDTSIKRIINLPFKDPINWDSFVLLMKMMGLTLLLLLLCIISKSSASSCSLVMCLYLQKFRRHEPFLNSLHIGTLPGSWCFLDASTIIWGDIWPVLLYSSTSSGVQWMNL